MTNKLTTPFLLITALIIASLIAILSSDYTQHRQITLLGYLLLFVLVVGVLVTYGIAPKIFRG